MKRLYNRYYKQILVALLMVNMIPVMFLGSYMIAFMKQQAEAVYSSYTSRLENYRKEFDTSFAYADVVLIRLGLRNSCQGSISKERKAANFQTFDDLREELILLDNTDESIDQVYLVSKSQNWILGSQTFEVLEKYPDKERILNFFETRKTSFWKSDNDHLYLCKRVPINSLDGSGMLITDFNVRKMAEEIMGPDEINKLIILDKEGQVMYGNRKDVILLEELSNLEKTQRLYHRTGIEEVTYEKNRYAVLENVSDYNGWRYVTIIPLAQIKKNLHQIYLMAFLLIASFITTDAAVVLLFSKKLFQPVDEIDILLKEKLPASESSYEEEGDLRDRINYVVERNLELDKQLKKEGKDKQQLFLRKIYRGEIARPTREMFEKNGLLLEDFSNGTYFVMAIKYRQDFERNEDKQLYLFALDNIVKELLDKSAVFPSVITGSLIYFTCYVRSDTDESAVMKIQMLAIMISTTVKKCMRRVVNIGISQSFSEIGDIVIGVNESNKALQDVIGSEEEVNFYHSHCTTSQTAKWAAAKKSRVQLLHLVDLGEKENCKKELEIYLNESSKLYYYMFKLEVCKLVSEILNIYNDYGLTPDYDKVGEIIDFGILKSVNTPEKLKNDIWSALLEPLFDVICSQAKERDIMQQILEYVMEHLEQDISLDECARHFNYNANYLSRWFKKKMGMTYTDFVTGKKMEICKSLLIESDVSVNELAERFGYSSPQNFIRVFKKYTLMTPGQYRKSERKKATKFYKEGEQ